MTRAAGRCGAAAILLGLAALPGTAVAAAPARAASAPRAAVVAPRARTQVHPLAIGTVVSLTTSGGPFRAGVLVLKGPDGGTVRIGLTAHTRVVQYRGRKASVARIPLTALLPGDVVLVRGWVTARHALVATLIFDTSVNGGGVGSPATSGG